MHTKRLFAVASALLLAGASSQALAHGFHGKGHDRIHDRQTARQTLVHPRRAADRFDERRDRQHRRIHHGKHSGSLTKRELRRLQHEQVRISRLGRRYASDGYISRAERNRLAKAQDRASRRIHHFKHNAIERHTRHGDGCYKKVWRHDR